MLYFLLRVCKKAQSLFQKTCIKLEKVIFKNALELYERSQVPWNKYYIDARYEFVKNILNNDKYLSYFSNNEPLPKGHGIALDERTIEWPWVISHLGVDDKHILDAGSALNHSILLGHSAIVPSGDGRKQLDIFTLAPEAVCETHRGISYHYGDLRSTPYKDCLFDAVVSISTLEHVGMDNSAFREDRKEHLPEDVKTAFLEIKRILKPSGKFFFSVPFGIYEDHTNFQQFDMALLESCAQIFTPAKREDSFFMYTCDGWHRCTADQCAEVKYASQGEVHADRAAAARAVACCLWWK